MQKDAKFLCHFTFAPYVLISEFGMIEIQKITDFAFPFIIIFLFQKDRKHDREPDLLIYRSLYKSSRLVRPQALHESPVRTL